MVLCHVIPGPGRHVSRRASERHGSPPPPWPPSELTVTERDGVMWFSGLNSCEGRSMCVCWVCACVCVVWACACVHVGVCVRVRGCVCGHVLCVLLCLCVCRFVCVCDLVNLVRQLSSVDLPEQIQGNVPGAPVVLPIRFRCIIPPGASVALI